jgi:hypothetical protein
MQEGEVDEYPELRTRRCEQCAGIANGAVVDGEVALYKKVAVNVTSVGHA